MNCDSPTESEDNEIYDIFVEDRIEATKENFRYLTRPIQPIKQGNHPIVFCTKSSRDGNMLDPQLREPSFPMTIQRRQVDASRDEIYSRPAFVLHGTGSRAMGIKS